jgi:glycosyltransferase involved in cell wall biosynthesis
MTKSSPTIMIGMPLFEGWEHVGRTLESIKRQSYQNFRVVISVDGGDERSYAACRGYLSDPRFEIVLQRERLFWEGNINWLAAQLREDYFCYWQHDDHCDETYLQKLIAHAVLNPHATSIYCDMQLYGTMDRLIQLPSTTGFALQRVLAQIDHFDPAVIRCLIRADAMRAALPIKMVFTWAMDLARLGELHRVPELLYFRHIRADSLTYTLLERPPEVMWQASMDWALGLMKSAYPLIQQQESCRLFALAAHSLINRLVHRKWLYDFETADHITRLKFVSEFLLQTQAHFGWQPYSDLSKMNNPEAWLRSRRGREALLDGEDLIIDALLSDRSIGPHHVTGENEATARPRNLAAAPSSLVGRIIKAGILRTNNLLHRRTIR